MGLFTITDIVSSFLQNFSIIGSTDIKWPDSLKWVHENLRVLQADLANNTVARWLNFTPLDIRAQHILLTNIIPFVLTVLLLLLFKSAFTVVWYAVLLASVSAMLVGTVLFVSPSSGQDNRNPLASVLLIIGSIVLIVTLVVYSLIRTARRYKTRAERIHPLSGVDSTSNEARIAAIVAMAQKALSSEKPFLIQARNLFLAFSMLFLGIIITDSFKLQFLRDQIYNFSAFEDVLKVVPAQIGWVLITFGVTLLFNWLMGRFAKTRRILTRLNNLFRRNAIKIVLLIMGLIYIPITSSLWHTTVCKTVDIPIGREFITENTVLELSSIRNRLFRSEYSGMASRNCTFSKHACPNANILCPASSDLRLVKDLSISCTKEMYRYYAPGSAMTLFTFAFGVPALFYSLISISVGVVRRIPVQNGESPTNAWKAQCLATNSSCRSLYSMFGYRWVYHKLLMLLHKLMVVTVVIWAKEYPTAVLFLLLVLSFTMALMSILARPYIRLVEDTLASICLLLNVANIVISLCVAFEVQMPLYVSPLMMSVNAVFPGSLVLVGIYLEIKDQRADMRRENEREKRMEAAKLENITIDVGAATILSSIAGQSEPPTPNTEITASQHHTFSSALCSSAIEPSTLIAASAVRATENITEKTTKKITEEASSEGVATATPAIPGPEKQGIITPLVTKLPAVPPEKTKKHGNSGAILVSPLPLPLSPLPVARRPEILSTRACDEECALEHNKNVAEEVVAQRVRESQERRMRHRFKRQQRLAAIDAMDQELDRKLMNMLINYFLILGIGCFLSLAVAVLGFIQTSGAATHIVSSSSLGGADGRAAVSTTTEAAFFGGPVVSLSTTEIEFAGYGSWSDFTGNCCCNVTLGVHEDLKDVATYGLLRAEDLQRLPLPRLVTETWKCVTPITLVERGYGQFLYKTRDRIRGELDGQSVRRYCSKSFVRENVTSDEPYLDEASQRYAIRTVKAIDRTITIDLW